MSDGRFGRLGGASGGRGSFHGSNRFQMNAMDLQTRPRPLNARAGPAAGPAAASASASAGSSARYGDNSALSARNMLIRHKLMERKRFDSADYAMDKNKRQKEGAQEDQAEVGRAEAVAPPTTAQVGVSAFYSALQDQQLHAPTPMTDVSPAMATGGSTTGRAAPFEAPGRYGSLTSGGAASARSILLQKKLREKKHFDSADYQLAQQQPSSSSPTTTSTSSPALLVGTTTHGSNGGSSPMDMDEEDADADASSINSPSAARVGVAGAISSGELRLAQMSPSVRGGGKFGGNSFGSPTRLPGQYSSLLPQPQDEDKQRFFVPAATGGGSEAAAAPAPSGASKYGKLCAAHVLIRRQLRERKRFDSADYAMEKQSGGQDEPADETRDEDEGGSAGALRGGHVVMTSPTKHHEHQRDTTSPSYLSHECCDAGGATSPSISHQVKHIKLSEDARAATGNGMGWAAASASASSSSSNSGGNRAAAMSQDSRLAARSIILQRKLAERKRFDSADYYKARSTTSG